MRVRDIGVFEHVPAALGPGDKRALLAVLESAGQAGRYVYLEIGSWQGGSLQPVVVDPRCAWAYSFDARMGGPKYEGMDASKMLANLARVPGAELGKLSAWDIGAEPEAVLRVQRAPNVCFIDGLHTPEAAFVDFLFCQAVARPICAYVFHDAYQVLSAIKRAQGLTAGTLWRLSDKMALLAVGGWEGWATEELRGMARRLGWTAGAMWHAGSRRWRRWAPLGLRVALSPVMSRVRRVMTGL